MKLPFRKQKYKVEVEGRNFLVLWDQAPQKYGFHAIRYVAAKNETDAELVTLELLTAECKEFILNAAGDKPMIRVAEVKPVASFDNLDVPGQGAEWYLE